MAAVCKFLTDSFIMVEFIMKSFYPNGADTPTGISACYKSPVAEQNVAQFKGIPHLVIEFLMTIF